MLLFAVLAALVVCSKGAVLPWVPTLDGRIMGGQAATIEEAPYQVALLFDFWGTGSYVHHCGGAIISCSAILTAAHCTDGTVARAWAVRAGSSLHNSGGQLAGVSRILQHADFDDSYDNDIAIMQLSLSFTLGAAVAVVSLPAQNQAVPDGSNAIVTGWGAFYEGGSSPFQLRKVTIPTINQEKCEAAYFGFSVITSNMLCAGRLGLGGKDACHGDSGGPLVVEGVLTGVTSWGRGCGDPVFPGVWARVSNYRGWIDSNVISTKKQLYPSRSM